MAPRTHGSYHPCFPQIALAALECGEGDIDLQPRYKGDVFFHQQLFVTWNSLITYPTHSSSSQFAYSSAVA